MTYSSTDKRLDLGRLGFHYLEAGDPEQPAVLILHGLMGVAREWDVLTEYLARRYRVVALDQRGHGLSDWADEYTPRVMAADAIALIERLELAPVRLFGHSMGGLVTMLVAADRPDLVESVVLADIAPDSLGAEWAADLPKWMTGLAESAYDSVDEATELWMEGNPFARHSLLRHYAANNLQRGPDGRLRWRFDAVRLADYGREPGLVAELWSAVDRITQPTLLIRGRHSPVLDPAAAAALLDRLPRALYAQIDEAAHDLGVEQPEAVAQVVSGFLGEGSATI